MRNGTAEHHTGHDAGKTARNSALRLRNGTTEHHTGHDAGKQPETLRRGQGEDKRRLRTFLKGRNPDPLSTHVSHNRLSTNAVQTNAVPEGQTKSPFRRFMKDNEEDRRRATPMVLSDFCSTFEDSASNYAQPTHQHQRNRHKPENKTLENWSEAMVSPFPERDLGIG